MSNVRWKPALNVGIAPFVNGLFFGQALHRFHSGDRSWVRASNPHRPPRAAPARLFRPLFRAWSERRLDPPAEAANDLIVDRDLLCESDQSIPRRRDRLSGQRTISALSAATVLTVAMAACSFPYFAPATLTDPYLEQHQLTQALELTDARSRWLGFMPRALSISQPRGGTLPYVAMDTKVPQGWLDILIALEDRNIRSWRSFHGIDVLSLGRATIGLSNGTGGPGGSTLVMQLVRSMRGIDPSQGSPWQKMRRKLTEITDGVALYTRLGGIDSPEFRQYLARHISLAVGAPGSLMGTPLHGIGMTSQVIWGVPPEDLDLAQQSILAAAVWRPIILAPDNDPVGTAARDERWQALVRRAILGLQLAYPDDWRARAAINELRAMSPPRPTLGGFSAASLTPAQRFQIAANPERRAAFLAFPELITARGELLNLFGRDGYPNVTGIRLTVDDGRNDRFREQMQAQLRQIELRLRGRLSGPLLDSPNRKAAADVTIAIMHQDRVVRLFSTSQEPIFNGSLAERDEQGKYSLARAHRQVGSVDKVMLAVLFGRTDNPDTRYCNERLPNGSIHNASGDAGLTCDEPGAWQLARSVFGKSMILPLIWRGRSVSEQQLRDMTFRYHLSLPNDAPARVALATGLATARPSDLVGMMQAVARGAMGRTATAAQPTIIGAFKTSESRAWRPLDRDPSEFDLRQDFVPHVRVFVRAVLSAPLQEGGTLAGLSRAVPGADLHIGKSGTTTTPGNQRPRDKYAVGAFHTRSGDWSYVFLVSSRDAKLGLGDNIPWTTFLPLLRNMLSELPSDGD